MNAPATNIIKALGGSSAVARLFGIAIPSVTNWKKTGIPKPRMMYLEAVYADKLKGIDIVAATSAPTVIPAEPTTTEGAAHE